MLDLIHFVNWKIECILVSSYYFEINGYNNLTLGFLLWGFRMMFYRFRFLLENIFRSILLPKLLCPFECIYIIPTASCIHAFTFLSNK